ncbi:MAG TPA: Stp1/IreP family PP2C-type Ser/Thr phosphatase [Ktedonobacteraceae bacterium]|nr:Stp1/IreP family PP2C-type Ser/Thr phosphatase [Ktedonobacteraceae bacterium]
MAKLLRLDVAQLTDVGRKREHNEDNMAYVIPKDPMVMMQKGALFIVADGMGGHAAGEVASEIAVDTISNAYYQDDTDDVPAALLRAIRRANAAIHQRAAENMLRSGMGTTCVAAVLRGNTAYVANVGDSRAYLVRLARIWQVSQDHSWVAEQVRAGLLTEEQARTHAQRNVITRSLGTQQDVEIDIFRETLEEGDTLVLCSDGLSGMVSDEEVQHTVEQFVPQESVYHLIERANENGGSDNITAIVARVQELGVEPPGVRQPVPVGGPELSNEDTARLFAPLGSGVNVATRNGEVSVPGSPFTYTSGPLVSPDSDTAPQPAVRTRKRRGRLFYPTVALLILFVLAACAGGGYYFLHLNQSQTITSTLNSADYLIQQAGNELTINPALALQNLAQAQHQLRDLQKNYTLNADTGARLTSLQTQLVNETKTAITNYNQGAHISFLPCTNHAPSSLNEGSSGTQAQAIAVIQAPDKTSYSYILSKDGKIYPLISDSSTQYSLGNAFQRQNTQITDMVGAGDKIFALSTQINGTNPDTYALNLLRPGADPTLQAAKSQSIDPRLTQDGKIPGLITAWDNNIYVVLMSPSTPNAAVILSYTLDNKGNLNLVKQTPPITVSAGIVSITAIPNQLFLLLSDGSVLSSQINADQTLAQPISVLISAPIAPPLATGAKDFTANASVPTTSQTAQKGRSPLTVPMPSTNNPATLSAGKVGSDGVVHLFIGDPANHRVLDLVIQPAASSGGPDATPTSTPGGTGGNNVTLDLHQQYASPGYFNTVKGVATVSNAQSATIIILGQNLSHVENLVIVSTDTVCPS